MKRFLLLIGLFILAGILTGQTAFSATYDATGTWSFSISNPWVDTGNVPGCSTQIIDTDTTVVIQTGDTFTMTLMGRTAQGTVSGSTYSASDSYPERGGTATLSVSMTLSSETSGAGTLTWVWKLGFLSCNGGSDLAIAKLDNDNTDPPESTVKLVFIHHSTGGNWLADPNSDQPYGGLGAALMNNNYYVSATNYGWGPDSIGDRTDIPNWPEWFTGSNSSAILNELYNENGQNFDGYGSWPQLSNDPGEENKIIMFKSCFPNSDLFGSPDDPPASEPNDLEFSVSNAKAVYNNVLGYFKTRQDKLFIVITAPPQLENEYSQDYQTPSQRAANARSFNNWLVHDWLNEYSYNNVGVFDYYNVLTDPGNHHRISGSQAEHIISNEYNFAAYPSDDSHPNSEGHQKATEEFIPMLNYYYNNWVGSLYPEKTTISGNVLYDETPLCAMVLANGRYMFSCEENKKGIYEMVEVPLNENGEIVLFCFVDGFVPFKQELTLEQAENFDINMSLASPDYPRMVLNPETESTADPDLFKISGTVASEDGTSLCAMVLANGQHVFSCGEETGKYELEVPLNTNGEIVLFGFADGFQPFRYTFKP